MSEGSPGQTTPQSPEGVSGRFITWVIVTVVLVTLALIGVAIALLRIDFHEVRNPVPTPSYPRAQNVGGIDQPSIWATAEGKAKNHESSVQLADYGWASANHRIARIPIDRAMQWLLDDANRGALENPDPATTSDAGAPKGDH